MVPGYAHDPPVRPTMPRGKEEWPRQGRRHGHPDEVVRLSMSENRHRAVFNGPPQGVLKHAKDFEGHEVRSFPPARLPACLSASLLARGLHASCLLV